MTAIPTDRAAVLLELKGINTALADLGVSKSSMLRVLINTRAQAKTVPNEFPALEEYDLLLQAYIKLECQKDNLTTRLCAIDTIHQERRSPHDLAQVEYDIVTKQYLIARDEVMKINSKIDNMAEQLLGLQIKGIDGWGSVKRDYYHNQDTVQRLEGRMYNLLERARELGRPGT